MALTENIIVAENVNVFVDRLVEATKGGWDVVPNQDLSLSVATGYWSIRMIKDVLPERLYSKQELDDMDYDRLKKIGKLYECFNRGRDVMVGKILEKQEQRKEK